jgi:hypothetical protein
MGIIDDFKERQQYRMSICEQCERYNSGNKSCMECGCYMPLKTAIPIFKCPKHKWD